MYKLSYNDDVILLFRRQYHQFKREQFNQLIWCEVSKEMCVIIMWINVWMDRQRDRQIDSENGGSEYTNK